MKIPKEALAFRISSKCPDGGRVVEATGYYSQGIDAVDVATGRDLGSFHFSWCRSLTPAASDLRRNVKKGLLDSRF